VPIGPTFTRHYFFGANTNGRDLAVRLLYGGRTSLLIGGIATIIIIVFGTLVGLLSGYLRGPVDAVLRWLMELVWSFPPVILGVVVGTALAFGGIGPIKGNSIFIPTLISGGSTSPTWASRSAARSCACVSRTSSTPRAWWGSVPGGS